ncbi:MAG: hypothetical protein RR246_00875 [Clostridia bacterium]
MIKKTFLIENTEVVRILIDLPEQKNPKTKCEKSVFRFFAGIEKGLYHYCSHKLFKKAAAELKLDAKSFVPFGFVCRCKIDENSEVYGGYIEVFSFEYGKKSKIKRQNFLFDKKTGNLKI